MSSAFVSMDGHTGGRRNICRACSIDKLQSCCFYTKDGKLTHYAFSCGYVEKKGKLSLDMRHGVYHLVGKAPSGLTVQESYDRVGDARQRISFLTNIPVDQQLPPCNNCCAQPAAPKEDGECGRCAAERVEVKTPQVPLYEVEFSKVSNGDFEVKGPFQSVRLEHRKLHADGKIIAFYDITSGVWMQSDGTTWSDVVFRLVPRQEVRP